MCIVTSYLYPQEVMLLFYIAISVSLIIAVYNFMFTHTITALQDLILYFIPWIAFKLGEIT